MCELHQHARVETWITPEDSKHLSAKMVQMGTGDSVPKHTTGPGREEVIICIYGKICIWTEDGDMDVPHEVVSGESFFIGENVRHSVTTYDSGAQYAYVATKKPKLTFEEIAAQDRKEFYALR